MIKHWKVIVIVLIVAGLIGSNVCYQQKLTKARLTNDVLKERARILEAEREAMRKKFIQLGEVSTARIEQYAKAALDAQTAANGIQVKSVAEIRAIRNQNTTLQAKYDVLEGDAVKLSGKVTALNAVIEPLKLQVDELKERDLVRLSNIDALQKQLADCQKLLKVSIENTDSLLNQPWFFKIFSKLTVVAGVSVGIDGIVRPAVALGVKIL